jgi:hypothetical protein
MQFAPLSSSAKGSAKRLAVTFGARDFEMRGSVLHRSTDWAR